VTAGEKGNEKKGSEKREAQSIQKGMDSKGGIGEEAGGGQRRNQKNKSVGVKTKVRGKGWLQKTVRKKKIPASKETKNKGRPGDNKTRGLKHKKNLKETNNQNAVRRGVPGKYSNKNRKTNGKKNK